MNELILHLQSSKNLNQIIFHFLYFYPHATLRYSFAAIFLIHSGCYPPSDSRLPVTIIKIDCDDLGSLSPGYSFDIILQILILLLIDY